MKSNNIIPITKLLRESNKVIDELNEKEVLVVCKDSEPQFVMITPVAYDKLLTKIENLDESLLEYKSKYVNNLLETNSVEELIKSGELIPYERLNDKEVLE